MNAFDASKVTEISKTAAQSFFNVNGLKLSGLDCLDVPQSLLILYEEQSFRVGKSLSACVTEALTDWLEAQTGMTILNSYCYKVIPIGSIFRLL